MPDRHRVAVAGGTGLAGRVLVRELHSRGHGVVVLSRSRGVDVETGQGLDLTGIDTVVDVLNTPAGEAEETRAFFGTTTEHLLAAEQRAGVTHHVALSIVGLERAPGNAHYQGKLRQEALVESSAVPSTILRVTQFFEFGEMVAGWNRDGDTTTVPPLLVQPVALADVAGALADVVEAAPQGRAPDLAGPERERLDDMARRTLAARHDPLRVETGWAGHFDRNADKDALLPGPGAQLGATTFEQWLATLEG